MSTPVAGWLARIGADPEAVAWARAYGVDWERAWAECPRGEWLLSITARMAIDPTSLVRAATACARLAMPYVPGGDAEALCGRALDDAEEWAMRLGPTARLVALAEGLERTLAAVRD